MTWALLGVVVVGLAAGWLSWTAGRVDRLHTRVEAARAALDAQLARRTAVALEAATSGLLDPAASLLLADAAQRARTAGAVADRAGGEESSREAAESDLTRALAAAFPDRAAVAQLPGRTGAAELLAELLGATRRVELARRFYNDTVATTRALRGRRLVRWFRLAGRAAMPQTVEIDDTPPPGLTG